MAPPESLNTVAHRAAAALPVADRLVKMVVSLATAAAVVVAEELVASPPKEVEAMAVPSLILGTGLWGKLAVAGSVVRPAVAMVQMGSLRQPRPIVLCRAPAAAGVGASSPLAQAAPEAMGGSPAAAAAGAAAGFPPAGPEVLEPTDLL